MRYIVKKLLFCLFYFLLVYGVWVSAVGAETAEETPVIIDSRMTRAEALSNNTFPEFVLASQELVTVRYYSFDGKLHEGQIVVHRDVVDDVREIFRDIEKSRFPITKVIPIVRYGWSDDKSIADNNTSAFNYRTIAGTKKLSDHAWGRAIDLNPYLNPWIGKSGMAKRPYDIKRPGTITAGDVVVQAFKKRGWLWGGSWKNSKDYQHFYKR